MPIVINAPPALYPYTHPTSSEVLPALRQDLFDQLGEVAATGKPRWQDADLLRALDRAVDRYSFYAPWLQTVLIAAVADSRLYGIPALANGPAWWLEAVEYPLGCWPRSYLPFHELPSPGLGLPPAPVTVALGSGLLTGSYSYRVSFLGPAGETLSSPASAMAIAAGQAIGVTLPLGPAPFCQGRRLYRTPAGGVDGSQLRLVTVADNSTTQFIDSVPDAALGPSGIPTADSTLNAPLFELEIPDWRLPTAVPATLGATCAGKHAWTDSGTSIPQPHQHIVLLGATAYALLALQVPTNDLFEYQDGELRDRISETAVPEHWLRAGAGLLARFESLLAEVKRQRAAFATTVTSWGSVPARWAGYRGRDVAFKGRDPGCGGRRPPFRPPLETG